MDKDTKEKSSKKFSRLELSNFKPPSPCQLPTSSTTTTSAITPKKKTEECYIRSPEAILSRIKPVVRRPMQIPLQCVRKPMMVWKTPEERESSLNVIEDDGTLSAADKKIPRVHEKYPWSQGSSLDHSLSQNNPRSATKAHPDDLPDKRDTLEDQLYRTNKQGPLSPSLSLHVNKFQPISTMFDWATKFIPIPEQKDQISINDINENSNFPSLPISHQARTDTKRMSTFAKTNSLHNHSKLLDDPPTADLEKDNNAKEILATTPSVPFDPSTKIMNYGPIGSKRFKPIPIEALNTDEDVLEFNSIGSIEPHIRKNAIKKAPSLPLTTLEDSEPYVEPLHKTKIDYGPIGFKKFKPKILLNWSHSPEFTTLSSLSPSVCDSIDTEFNSKVLVEAPLIKKIISSTEEGRALNIARDNFISFDNGDGHSAPAAFSKEDPAADGQVEDESLDSGSQDNSEAGREKGAKKALKELDPMFRLQFDSNHILWIFIKDGSIPHWAQEYLSDHLQQLYKSNKNLICKIGQLKLTKSHRLRHFPQRSLWSKKAFTEVSHLLGATQVLAYQTTFKLMKAYKDQSSSSDTSCQFFGKNQFSIQDFAKQVTSPTSSSSPSSEADKKVPTSESTLSKEDNTSCKIPEEDSSSQPYIKGDIVYLYPNMTLVQLKRNPKSIPPKKQLPPKNPYSKSKSPSFNIFSPQKHATDQETAEELSETQSLAFDSDSKAAREFDEYCNNFMEESVGSNGDDLNLESLNLETNLEVIMLSDITPPPDTPTTLLPTITTATATTQLQQPIQEIKEENKSFIESVSSRQPEAGANLNALDNRCRSYIPGQVIHFKNFILEEMLEPCSSFDPTLIQETPKPELI